MNSPHFQSEILTNCKIQTLLDPPRSIGHRHRSPPSATTVCPGYRPQALAILAIHPPLLPPSVVAFSRATSARDLTWSSDPGKQLAALAHSEPLPIASPCHRPPSALALRRRPPSICAGSRFLMARPRPQSLWMHPRHHIHALALSGMHAVRVWVWILQRTSLVMTILRVCLLLTSPSSARCWRLSGFAGVCRSSAA